MKCAPSSRSTPDWLLTVSETEGEVQFVRKAWQAYQFKLAGMTLTEIKERLGYRNNAAVAKAISEEMRANAQKLGKDDRETILSIEMARLEFMLNRIWEQVNYGDLKAVDAAVKIIALQARLTQLDQIDAATHTATVLVVGGQEGDYIQKLKELAS